jgi:hypothetical protein
MSAGFRLSFYSKHDNTSGSQDTSIQIAPAFSTDKTNDYVRVYLDNSSNNRCLWQWNESQVASLNYGQAGIVHQSTKNWHCYRLEFNFAAGTTLYAAYRVNDGANLEYEAGSFTGLAGPTDKTILELSNFGSTSTWSVFQTYYIGTIWVGGLTDAWPSTTGAWTV